jgi:hypothetical protein
MNNLNKLKCIGLLSLFLLIFCFTTISSAETASDLILQEAQNEATQLEAVRSALLLDYSEKYNQYLSDYKTWIATKTGPEPTEPLIGRDSSGNLSWTGALSYLPSGFGTASGSTLTRSDGVQYTLLATGDFVTVAVSNISAAAAELVPNYMPLASYDSATGKVSLLVTPETSGVAMELLNDVIENYVRRDGAGDPTFYDGATVTLGAGATLEWNNNDGQILGVSLLRGNNLAIQQIDTLSFGTGTLSLSQPSAGQLKIAGAGGSLYVEGPKLSSSTGDLILESSTVIATGEKLYIGDKGGAGTYSMSTANGELKMESSAGYVAFKRTGSQLQVNTDASEIYLTKNLRVSRVIGTADRALNADHATNADYATTAGSANSVGGKTWSDIQSYVDSATRNAAASPMVMTGTWYPHNSSTASYTRGYLVAGGHRRRFIHEPNAYYSGRWYSIDKNLGSSNWFPTIPRSLDSSIELEVKSIRIGIYLGGTWESGSWAKVYRRPLGDTSGGTLILDDSYPRGGSWRGKWVYFTAVPGYEYKIIAFMPNMCVESYDDGYRVLMAANRVVYAAKFK